MLRGDDRDDIGEVDHSSDLRLSVTQPEATCARGYGMVERISQGGIDPLLSQVSHGDCGWIQGTKKPTSVSTDGLFGASR